MKEVAPVEWISDMEYHMPAGTTWADEDDVPVLEDLQITKTGTSQLHTVIRWMALLCAAAAMIANGQEQLGTMRAALRGLSASFDKNKHSDFQLPLY